MTNVLHLVVLFICLRWLYKSNKTNAVLLGIVFTFLGGTLINFFLTLAIDNEFLDGIIHLIIAGGSAVIFWIFSIVIILSASNNFSAAEKLAKVFIASIAILLPLLIYFMLSNISIKIGG